MSSIINTESFIKSINVLNYVSKTKEVEDLMKKVIVKGDTFKHLPVADTQRLKEELFADAIHSKECKLNHTDGCSYHYDTWEKARKGLGYSKKEYLEKVKRILNNFPNVDIDDVFDYWRKFNS